MMNKKKKVNFTKEPNKNASSTDNNASVQVGLLNSKSRIKQKISPASRTEASSEISLLKLKTSRKRNDRDFQKPFVSMKEVLADLKNTSSNEVQKLKLLQQKSKPIRAPLEKVHAKKIEREVAFDNVKRVISRWDSTIKANRIADHLKFPLENNKVDIHNEDHKADEDFLSTFREQTPLEKKMAELLGRSKVEKEEKELEENDYDLTLGELIKRRRMFAKIRAQASFKAAKAWRQNKIKSKSYHRLLRRERLKQQINDFESLKERDPEAALKQLESLEKARAQERVTLRHRNTGKWAKSQIVRAKYNKQSRAALSEQIQKNRELTKKRKIVHSSDSEDETKMDEEHDDADIDDGNSDNKSSESNEFETFLTNYRNYETAKLTKDDGKRMSVADMNKRRTNIEKRKSDVKKQRTLPSNSSIENKSVALNSNPIDNDHDDDTDEADDLSDYEKSTQKTNIDRSKLLDEGVSANGEGNIDKHPTAWSNNSGDLVNADEDVTYGRNKVDINPEDFLTLKRPKTQLLTDIPSDLVDIGDDMDDVDQDDHDRLRHTIISEAFADDELVSEFRQEKQNAVEDSMPKDINQSLPGWGSWTGGKNNKTDTDGNKKKNKRVWVKNKRLLFRIPAAPPRKDCNKGFVIINEEKDSKLKEHLVNELPYPFTSVKGFESSIRAPLGREWVPETVHQNMITPPVQTKMGTVIEPMDVGELISRPDDGNKKMKKKE